MPKKPDYIGCTIKRLPLHLQMEAARAAVAHNPANRPGVEGGTPLPPERLAVLTSKYWGSKGVHLTVGFLDSPPADLRARIVSHMNAWGQYCNAKFVETNTDPQVRIARAADGYWSYLGTDILSIPAGEATMNLQDFTMSTEESEYRRVVRHETGHCCGFPHEHMRRQLVQRLDPQKTVAYFLQEDGWSSDVTQQQVLTPIDDATIMATASADQDSIMCYQLPGSITTDGQPIRGGTDIEATDRAFAAKLYPLQVAPPPPPPPPPGPPTASIKSQIDKIFAALESQYARRPVVLSSIQWVQALVDQYVTTHHL